MAASDNISPEQFGQDEPRTPEALTPEDTGKIRAKQLFEASGDDTWLGV